MDDSDDGIIRAEEDAIEFNPPEISSQKAATGFEGEFTETVIIKESSEKGNNMLDQLEDKPEPRKRNNLMESARLKADIVSGLGADDSDEE